MFFGDNQKNVANQAARSLNLWINVLLSLALLSVQSASLAHAHEDDLQRQSDCNLCLKVNSSEDFLAASTEILRSDVSNIISNDLVTALPYFKAVPANSRSPPLV